MKKRLNVIHDLLVGRHHRAPWCDGFEMRQRWQLQPLDSSEDERRIAAAIDKQLPPVPNTGGGTARISVEDVVAVFYVGGRNIYQSANMPQWYAESVEATC